MATSFRLALVQLAVSANKAQNLIRAKEKVKEAVAKGAQVVALPECFNSPYGTSYFADYAESIPGESSKMLSDVAKETGAYVIGGSIPERDADGKLFNTSLSYGPSGDLLGKHRKSFVKLVLQFAMICALLNWHKYMPKMVYAAAVSPARDEKASYIAWANSTIVNPWGNVVEKADHTEQIIFSDIDLNYVDQVRAQVPVQFQKRHDIYKVDTLK
ncbi:Omega-amidase NIT2 [Exaiptasia diaphana]|nr:Omega-amidase NIT2 [Exaiptasia diaphana]